MNDRNPGQTSRRQFLARGSAGAAGAAALLAGCSTKVTHSNVPFTPHTSGAALDVDILNGLIRLEYEAIAAYTASVPQLMKIALEQGSVPPPPPPGIVPPPPPPPPPGPLKLVPPLAVTVAQNFLRLELAHVGELNGLVRQAGGKPAEGEPSYDFGHPRDKRELVELMHRVEQKQVYAYWQATQRLTIPRLRAAAAVILANEAQQIMVLRLELGMPPIPSPFVRGLE